MKRLFLKLIEMKKKTVVCLLFALMFSVSAFGDYTPVLQSGEPNHAQILGDIYGDGTPFIGQGVYLGDGAWTEFVSPGGTIIARRIHDFNDFLTDQIWSCDAEVFAKAKNAGLDQSFGWNQGGIVGDNYEELLTDANIGDLSGVAIDANGDFLWGIQPTGYEFWSLQSENSDQMDHMVTYKIEPYNDGLDQFNAIAGPQISVWLLCFEDLPSWHFQNDWDFNDFVVEATCRVPEPTTIALFGLGSLLLSRSRRFNKK